MITLKFHCKRKRREGPEGRDREVVKRDWTGSEEGRIAKRRRVNMIGSASGEFGDHGLRDGGVHNTMDSTEVM
ncbi:hypothetical protein E2C01_078376 [Portunus trituberculatus]|uniref:Uncharacterized protein n=1 Tax=Portunus trituberculatus TaxID=210409 RepID=A0A5B7IE56_PORTR|nr:hypothetical protein [Portunus trituberculatus]